MSHDMPDRPWQKVGVDLSSYKKNEYLVTINYKSSTRSKSVITKLKAHFPRMGIPDTVVSDNGPQLSSCDFAHFSKKWGFEHTLSSLHQIRSNGKIIRNAKKCGEDQSLALL